MRGRFFTPPTDPFTASAHRHPKPRSVIPNCRVFVPHAGAPQECEREAVHEIVTVERERLEVDVRVIARTVVLDCVGRWHLCKATKGWCGDRRLSFFTAHHQKAFTLTPDPLR